MTDEYRCGSFAALPFGTCLRPVAGPLRAPRGRAHSSAVGFLVAVIAAGALIACRGETPAGDTQGPVTRDSAGVRITESSVALLERAPVLIADSPSLRIGVIEGEEHDQLFQVRGVRRLADGSILVLNAGTHELRRFDASGRWLSSSGRRGAGPGEMGIPAVMLSLQDSTWVLDIGTRRFLVADPAGNIVRTERLTAPLSGLAGLIDATVAVTAAPEFPRGVYEQVLTSEVVVEVAGLSTGTRDTVAVLPGFQVYQYTVGELVRSVRVPFTIMPTVRVRGEEIFITDGRTPEVRVYNRKGEMSQVIRVLLPPSAVSENDWQAAVESSLGLRATNSRDESALRTGELDRRKRVYQQMQRPAAHPYFDDMMLDGDGNVWVRQSQPAQARQQNWIGFDAKGSVIARVRLPTSVLVREMSAQWALGSTVDAMGVEYVLLYPLALN